MEIWEDNRAKRGVGARGSGWVGLTQVQTESRQPGRRQPCGERAATRASEEKVRALHVS